MPSPRSPSAPPPSGAWSKERKIYLAVGIVILLIALVLLLVSL
jgi:hypothetical protein